MGSRPSLWKRRRDRPSQARAGLRHRPLGIDPTEVGWGAFLRRPRCPNGLLLTLQRINEFALPVLSGMKIAKDADENGAIHFVDHHVAVPPLFLLNHPIA
jgi:hypothetical protein